MLVFHSEIRLLWDCYPLLTMIPGATIVGIPCKISVGFTAGFWLKPPLFSTKEPFFFQKKHMYRMGIMSWFINQQTSLGGGHPVRALDILQPMGQNLRPKVTQRLDPSPTKTTIAATLSIF